MTSYLIVFCRFVLVSALRAMNNSEKITEAPKDCSDSGSIWETGKKLFTYETFFGFHILFFFLILDFERTITNNNASFVTASYCNVYMRVCTYIHAHIQIHTHTCISDNYLFGYSIRYILQQVLPHGSTGRVAFDDNGDRIYAEYDIINIQYASPNNKTQVSVGQYFYPAVSKSLTKLTPPSKQRKIRRIKICNYDINVLKY